MMPIGHRRPRVPEQGTLGSLGARGVAAAAVHSQLDDAARGDAIRAFVRGELAVLYVSPERAVLDGRPAPVRCGWSRP